MISNKTIKFRQNKIGGSDIPQILGRSKYGGPVTVIQRIRGTAPDSPIYKPEFEFGNRWEDLVAQLFAENHPEYMIKTIEEAYREGLLSRLVGFRGRVIEFDDGSISVLDFEHDYIVENIDRLVICRSSLAWGVLEIKTASEFVASDWGPTGSSDGFPSYYEDQAKFYAYRLGAHFCKGAVLIGQRDYREYEIPLYTQDEANYTMARVERFWKLYVRKGMPCPPSFPEASTVAITETSLDVSGALWEKIVAHKKITDEIKALQDKLKPLDQDIRATAATHTDLIRYGEVVFTQQTTTVEKVNVEALKRFYPEVYAAVTERVQKKRFSKRSGYKNIKTSESTVVPLNKNRNTTQGLRYARR